MSARAFHAPAPRGTSVWYLDMGKTIAILQSSYIPWKGYFDLIRSVDEFILLDDVQYTRRDWRNRNLIKTPRGPQWLTIPVQIKGRYFQAIQDMQVSSENWNEQHWKAICHNYAKAPHFEDYRTCFERLYLDMGESRLSLINVRFLKEICGLLGIATPIRWSSEFSVRQERSERLLDLCLRAGATEYLSGPSAKNYLNLRLFEDEGVNVRFAEYSAYPEYRQLFPPFDHHVSIVDLIFNEGPKSIEYMRRQ